MYSTWCGHIIHVTVSTWLCGWMSSKSARGMSVHVQRMEPIHTMPHQCLDVQLGMCWPTSRQQSACAIAYLSHVCLDVHIRLITSYGAAWACTRSWNIPATPRLFMAWQHGVPVVETLGLPWVPSYLLRTCLSDLPSFNMTLYVISSALLFKSGQNMSSYSSIFFCLTHAWHMTIGLSALLVGAQPRQWKLKYVPQALTALAYAFWANTYASPSS